MSPKLLKMVGESQGSENSKSWKKRKATMVAKGMKKDLHNEKHNSK